MIEGDIFRIIVKCPDFEAQSAEKVERGEQPPTVAPTVNPYSGDAACIAAEKRRVQQYGYPSGIGAERPVTYP